MLVCEQMGCYTNILHVYLLFCVVPLPDEPSCGTYTGSCEHYERCVEPLLACGEEGFTLAYGRRHCQVIHEINATLMSSWMMEWLHSHESCLQQKVFELATTQACPTPNPVSCLQFEATALSAFEECFTRNVSLLCNSHEMNNNLTMIVEQLGTLVQRLGINEYYRHEIVESISRAINTCNHPNISQVVNSVQPSSNRIVFCATVGGDPVDFPVSSYVDQVARLLERPAEQFEYAGRAYDDLCHRNAPPALANIPDLEYHYVIWKPTNDDALRNNLGPSYYTALGTTTYFDFYKLEALCSYGHCGDWVRRAGELCDTGVRNLIGQGGCNGTCMPSEQYECDTWPLISSTCHRTVCGDGLRTSNEDCDDGNNASGDGCAECLTELGYVCSGPYNGTSICKTIPPTTPTTPSSPTTSPDTDSPTDTPTRSGEPTQPPDTREPIERSSAPLNLLSHSILLTVLLVLLISL